MVQSTGYANSSSLAVGRDSTSFLTCFRRSSELAMLEADFLSPIPESLGLFCSDSQPRSSSSANRLDLLLFADRFEWSKFVPENINNVDKKKL